MPPTQPKASKGQHMKPLRARQHLGKYRIEKRIGSGGFAAVYEAMDTIEGIRTALKVPHPNLVTDELLEQFKREVRLSAKLKHPNILPIKNAEFIDGYFVVAFPLGISTLDDRLRKRISLKVLIEFIEQILQAVSYAHESGIIHCDIKPENLILFPDNTLMLSDFGISKVAMNTICASGSGTVGYVAPEQAMGKPSFRSDVFSLAVLVYRMLTGVLPEWPFQWPPPEFSRLRSRVHPDLITLIQRAMNIDPKCRFRDATQMLMTFQKIRRPLLQVPSSQVRAAASKTRTTGRHWRTVQQRQFKREFGAILETRSKCPKCEGPVSESMQHCPWCSKGLEVYSGSTKLPQVCPRCNRGMKLDWCYCPWCFGKGFTPEATQKYDDKRYVAKCANSDCARKVLMPFMRYCPWCRRRVRRKWKIPGSQKKCTQCSWGVIPEYWSYCPWCKAPVSKE